MPRGGSKKGEHRGNAKRRPEVAETPGEIMREALAQKPVKNYASKVNRVKKLDTRLQQAQAKRVLHLLEGDVRDMTPREVMLNNMHYFMQGAYDWQGHLMLVVDQPLTVESAREIERAQGQIERYRQLASEDAYKVAPYLHPRLAAIVTNAGAGENPADVIQTLLDDIDRRQRDPRVIEHQAQGKEKA